MARKPRILIVDDSPEGRKTLEALLLVEGFDLAFASSGEEALAVIHQVDPDVVLLDVMMPGTDGFEVCRRLRDDSCVAEVPILLVTALDDRASRLEGLHSGADDFISKPFSGVELRTRVRSIARLNRYRRLVGERELLSRVVECSDEGYVRLDEKDHVLYANPSARRLLGATEEVGSCVGHSFLPCILQRYRCHPEHAWEGWPLVEEPCQGRFLVRPEGCTHEAVWLRVDIMAVTGSDTLVRIKDVSAEVGAQQAVWSLRSLISHKLRTPMTKVLGGLTVLQASFARYPLASPAVQSGLEIAVAGARELQVDLERVLKAGSAPAGAGRPARFCLGDVAALALSLAGNWQMDLEVAELRDGIEDTHVALSASAMEVVLSEVLDNARKFHPTDRPTVEIEVVSLGGEPATVAMRVRDDGVQLSPAQLKAVWRPFYQAEKYFTGAVEGMGLGLSRVSSLVWSVGGTCDLRNRADGKGVEVELVLPLA